MKRIVCFQDVGEMVQPAEDSIVVISNGLSISGEMIGVGGTKVGFQINAVGWFVNAWLEAVIWKPF